jgi:hypothetical protein
MEHLTAKYNLRISERFRGLSIDVQNRPKVRAILRKNFRATLRETNHNPQILTYLITLDGEHSHYLHAPHESCLPISPQFLPISSRAPRSKWHKDCCGNWATRSATNDVPKCAPSVRPHLLLFDNSVPNRPPTFRRYGPRCAPSPRSPRPLRFRRIAHFARCPCAKTPPENDCQNGTDSIKERVPFEGSRRIGENHRRIFAKHLISSREF